MKTWHIATNSHPAWRKGAVWVYERPWWLSLTEWFAFAVNISLLRYVKLPNWPRICWDADDPEFSTCSLREWYGDLGGVVHSHITNPLFQWVWSHPKNKKIAVEIGYDRLRDLFQATEPKAFER